MILHKVTGSQATLQRLLQQMPEWTQLTSPGSRKVLSRLQRCHTAEFGYHAYRCSDSDCGAMQYVYHPSFIGTAATGIAPPAATTKKKSG